MHDISRKAIFILDSLKCNEMLKDKNISVWRSCTGIANALSPVQVFAAFDCYTLLAGRYIYISQRINIK